MYEKARDVSMEQHTGQPAKPVLPRAILWKSLSSLHNEWIKVA